MSNIQFFIKKYITRAKNADISIKSEVVFSVAFFVKTFILFWCTYLQSFHSVAYETKYSRVQEWTK